MASSYMYPAMARSFRTAGMQLATHFSYDPTFLAPYNTEYNTHFMNLVYAPQKALSLMICAEVFRTIPLYKDFGVYPDNTSFGPFKVSYENDLAEMVTEEKFIYTNHTDTKIRNPEKLKLIAGWGNSSLIEYEGTGAYFLDKMGEGIWRLELMPDAIIVDNLFGQNNLEKTRAVIQYKRNKMKFNLPEFNEGYFIQSVDWRDSIIYREVAGGTAELKPGVYLLMAAEYDQEDYVTLTSMKNRKLDEYFAPPSNNAVNAIKFDSDRKARPDIDGIILYNPSTDYLWLNRQWVRGSGWLPDTIDGKIYTSVKLNGLVRRDNENLNAMPVADYTMRHYFGDLINNKNDLLSKTSITIEAYTPDSNSFPLQVALIMKDGTAFGTNINIDQEKKVHTISLTDLARVKTVLMPRPYPTFLPYYSVAGNADTLKMDEVESLQISIGPGIRESNWGNVYEMMLGEVKLK
ncbi:MAG TPA: hypothetical protein VJ111_00080, partial [Chitinophagaceae bacterium]|nr:hypothetical protein [Chitinophagaceae bacterium]